MSKQVRIPGKTSGRKIAGWAVLLLALLVAGPRILSENDESEDASADKVHLEHADELIFNKEYNPDAQLLIGNVIFRHQNSFMFCDSAYFYELSNSLEAFSNVRMEQGDTIFIYGDYLFYDGNTSLARLRDSVKMINSNVTLYTDSLNYDRAANIGYYFEGGRVVDEENDLYSIFGRYSPDTKLAFFKDSVHLTNEKFDLYSDTLVYNTSTKMAHIVAYTEIISSDSSTIYSSSGWYDTEKDLSVLMDRSVVWNESRSLTGDSISYDKISGIGEAYGNVILNDTVKKVILEGNYLFYDDLAKYAYATDRAMAVEYSQGDSIFIHADTLSFTEIDTLHREIKAFYGARFFKSDMQGVCDSMLYLSADSVLCMYYDPYIWSDSNQITGDSIHVFMNDSTINYAKVMNNAFSIEQVDTAAFNQLRGTFLNAFFDEGEIRRIFVDGNAESIYFPVDEKSGEFIGVNKSKSSYLSIEIKENKMKRIVFWPSPTGVMTPIDQADKNDKFFENFNWNTDIRPIDKMDIFRKAEVPVDTTRQVGGRGKFQEYDDD